MKNHENSNNFSLNTEMPPSVANCVVVSTLGNTNGLISLTFSGNAEGEDCVVGKLWVKDGVLSFEGNCDESAKIFFEEIIKLNQSTLKG